MRRSCRRPPRPKSRPGSWSSISTADTLAGLFPDLYHRRIANAVARQEANQESARQEAALIATATARTNMVERAYKDVRRRDDRERSDRERLDLIAQKRGQE